MCLGLGTGIRTRVVLWWMVMFWLRKGMGPARGVTAVAGLACSTLLSTLLLSGMPSAAAAPPSDSRGFIDSTARCAAPNTAVMFGYTASSRVAICTDGDGEYQYRGVRVRDGARLITSAERAGDGEFVAESGGATYTVTVSSLLVEVGRRVIRDEAMIEVFEPGGEPQAPTRSAPSTPSTSKSLPPPLPAEVGGSGS